MLVRLPKGVVHVVERLAPGGIETFVLDLIRSGSGMDRVISLQGTVPTLLSAWPALGDISDRLDALERGPGLQPALVPRLVRTFRTIRPQAVVLHHIGPLLYGGLAAKLAGVSPILYVEHDAWHYQNRRECLIAAACFRLIRPRVVAVSDQVGEAISRIAPKLPVTVIPPGVAMDRFMPADKATARRRLGLPTEARIVGSAGRLVPVKAHHVLIRALARLPSPVVCAIAGGGPELNNLQNLTHELGLQNRVHFLGHRDDLWQVYPAFDVFCLPSEAEGLPRTILEAQACGVPVVASAVGGIPEAVHPQASALVPASDPDALAEALSSILSQAEHLPSPRDFIAEKMSLTATSQQYREQCLQ
jgi:glycosyltransferase involved in cell wall biosynthesis